MQRKAILIGLMVMALLFAIAAAQGGPLTVRTQVDKTSYAVGDLVTLKVFVENNPGLHSIYFDLAYDGSVLSFDSLSEGSMVTGELRQKEFLYAASDPQTSTRKGQHLIVSYALQGPGVVSPRGGLLLEARFRVIAPGNSNIQYKFDYAAKAVTDGAGNEISGVVWQTPQSFSIGNGGTGAFVLITKPHEMQVINGDQVEVDAVCSPGLDYFIKYENQTNQYTTDFISAAQIDLPSKMIPLVYGYNNIMATLYQRVNGVDYIIATNNVRVYRPQDGLYVKILSPKSHQLVNTDMVDVVVSSPYEQVMVNGLPAVYYEPGTGSHKLYRARLWLKKGFNTITAEATGADNVKFKDTIQIYYQKDSSIFSFTMPRVGEYFKPGAGTYLRIEGEIDSPYRSGAITADGLPAPNTVTLRVIFKPFNYMKDTLVLVNDKLGKIVESTGSIDARSQYKFTHEFEIPLEGLGSGEIEIIAYKNKEGNKWDDEIHRIVYLDDNRLWIDLFQPNVYTHDLIDTYQRITNFNETKNPQMNNIDIAADGAIGLAEGNPAVSKIETLANTSDLAEAKDGTLYALTNSSNGSMSIYKKGVADQSWVRVLTRPQMYGYALCMSDIGLLVGVSNLYSTEESGLYLLKEKALVNIRFPVTLQHVQFIEERDGLINIYGNYYNYLYSFDVNTLTKNDSGLMVESINRTSFSNNLNLKQFVLSSDGLTAVLRTESGQVLFYNKTEAGYLEVTVPGPDGNPIRNLSFKNIIAGEYANGDYNDYLLILDQTKAINIMEYKNGPRRYFASGIKFSEPLCAAGFSDNSFLLLSGSGDSYQLKKGQIYFSSFYPSEEPTTYRFPETVDAALTPARFFVTSKAELYLGIGAGLTDNLKTASLYYLYHKLDQTDGKISFNYVNDDMEGLTGFSFEIDPIWLISEGTDEPVEFGFAVKEKAQGASGTGESDLKLFQKSQKSLSELLLESENQFYTLTRHYDPMTEREVIHFEFKNIQENRYLNFQFKLRPVGNTSPGIYNLKVYKKVNARVCAGDNQKIVVPIQGYIYDRTVNEVTIQQAKIPLGNDRSFNYNYEIYRSQQLVPIEISCINSTGATASLKFMVEIVNSENGLGEIRYRQDGNDYVIPDNTLEVTNEKLTLSGKYYGLEGAVVGYEIYGYQYKNGVESVDLVKRGLFETTRDESAFPDLGVNRIELGAGYTAGYFQEQEITLIPGKQQLRIYVENPGGLRSEFKINDKYPDVNYCMLPEDQAIIFDLDSLTPVITVQTVPIRYRANLEAYEELESTSQGSRYLFKRSYELHGEIKSLYNFSNLIVKSFTSGLTFEDGSTETSVKVETGNRFKIKVKIAIEENVAAKDFDLGVFPTIPSLSNLKTGVRLSVNKNFKDTNFIPDFSRIHPENWSNTEKESKEIPIRVKFNRSDLPAPEAWLTLTVNSGNPINGYLEASDGTYYLLKDENHQIIPLPNLKVGRNRIQWVLWYRSINGQNSYIMSSSSSNKDGMGDDVFDYYETIETAPTRISFSPDLTTQYYSDTLPEMNITKDPKTKLAVNLNGVIIREDPGETVTSLKVGLTGNKALREGKNELTVTFKESLQQWISKTYSFLYDSKNPDVVITSWQFATDDRTLEELTALVTEANFDKAYLYYGSDIISKYPAVSIVAADKYLLHWTGLAVNEMDPGAKTITVRAYDHSDKEGLSDTLKSIPQRPGEENIKDTQISLPIYNTNNGYPVLANESNYKANPFPEHTKFAPRNYLPRESAKAIIGNSGDYLTQNIVGSAPSGTTKVTNGWVGGSPRTLPGVYFYDGFNYSGGVYAVSTTTEMPNFWYYNFSDGSQFYSMTSSIWINGLYTVRFWFYRDYTGPTASTSVSIPNLRTIPCEYDSNWHDEIASAKIYSNYTTTPPTPKITVTPGSDKKTLTVSWQPVDISIGVWAYELQSQINNSGIWTREAYFYPGVTSFIKDIRSIDNIKFRLRVIDTNYNHSGWATSDSYQHFFNDLLIPDQYKYLVFKVAKDFMVVKSKDNIADTIKFQAAGSYQKMKDNTIEPVNPQILALNHTHTIESYNYIYYMVEIPELKNEFLKYCQSIADQLINTSGYAVYDWGSLQVLYDNPVNPDRLVDIYATGYLPETQPPNQETRLNDLAFYDPGYEEPGSPGTLNSSLNYFTDQVKVNLNRSNPATTSTINFWLRLEDEGLGDNDFLSELQTISKRILTITDADDYNLIGIEYQGNSLSFNDLINSIFKPQIGTLYTLIDSQVWNLITLRITEEPSLEVFINNKLCLQYPITPEMAAKLLAKDLKLMFGPEMGKNFNTGFYSVAGAYYIDRLLTFEEAQRLYSLYDKYSAADLNYYFQHINDEFGAKCGKLRPITGCGDDFFSNSENSNPIEDRSKGSLKASHRMLNLLKKSTNSSGKQYVILGEADTFVAVSMDLESVDDSFTLIPKGKLGRYYFGDKNSNYSLGVDRWYSISGSVLDIDESNTNAKLVLRINEREQSWQLKKGSFHFIYDNTLSKLTPSQVKLYIESDGPVTLGTDMAFNQGNYILKESLSRTALKTQYAFGLAGMVSLRYKPLNVNGNGLVNYQDAVLFDSELFKIYTIFDGNQDDAVFAVDIREDQGVKTIVSNVKVRDGWQHLQLSYDFKESSNKSVYFYINGTLAGVETVSLQPFGSLAGIQPVGENVWLGCDRTEQNFACGYLDEVKLSKYYQQSNFSNQEPAQLIYSAESKQVIRQLADNLTIESEKYTLEALDGSYKEEGDTFPVNLGNIPAGRYRITEEMVINGHNYRKILFFNIDNRPRFIMKEKTPIVFKNVAGDLRFTFNPDVSYRFGDERLLYLGLAGEITYQVGDQLFTQTRYLVQDFLNQQTSRWLLGIPEGEIINWGPANTDNFALLELVFPNIATAKSVDCRFKYFYFETNFSDTEKFEKTTIPDLTCRIPLAVLTQPIIPEKDQAGNEYKLVVDVTDGEGGGWDPIFQDIQIEYETTSNKDGIQKQGSCGLSKSGDNSGKAELYYDDILSWNGNSPIYDAYICKLRLKYQGVTYMETNGIQLNWGRKTEEIPMATIQVLEINEFSLLSIDQRNPEKPKASFYLKYTQNGLGVITPKLEIIKDDRIQEADIYIGNINTESAIIIKDVILPKGLFRVRLSLHSDGFIRSRELEINNSVEKPEITLTNGVDSLIQYNNVLFSWKGYYKNRFIDSIEYQYNLDNHGWTTPNSGWRSVRFYNLEEGYHTFQVRALYHGVPSEIRQVTFFVDINKPKFDSSKIKVEKVYDGQGVFYAVKLSGSTGAINDISLEQLTIKESKVQLQADGSFTTTNLPITADGVEKIVLTASDRAGNYTDYQVTIDNPITEILFPTGSQRVRYSPLCLTGKINSQIQAGLNIYVADSFSTTKGDYSGWKKAKINPDRTFFVEDLYINPGTTEREIVTKLRLAVVFDSGKTFEREIELRANEILRPIEMKLSTHAAEGENSDTQVSIDCQANVGNISSWSIDFNGDGIYDLVDLTKNPASPEARTHSWTHKYSSLGLVSPRVRVITGDGDFFSTSDTLIIHEKIKEASFKLVTNPLAISTVRMIDESNRVFVLHQQDDQRLVEVYEILRNDNYISRKLFDINLTALEIHNPVKIKALDKDNLIIAANIDALGAIYHLRANQFGNYEVTAVLYLEDEVADLTIRDETVLVSMIHRRDLFRAKLVDGILDQRGVTYENVVIPNALPLGEKAGLETDGNNIFIADYYNQRIIQISPSLRIIDQFGARGNGEAEFIWPELIQFHQNRIFVSDSGRHDIQVFDRNYTPICTLGYRNDPDYYNYVEPEFFADIADFEVIAREEGNRLYYYALVLSRSVGKLSMIRLPQWEELKVRVRNNKIVFVKEGEIFTAKPDGSDLVKVLSSDSLPRIEGAIDYPALASDGRRLAFTSKIRLYNGQTGSTPEDGVYTYSNLYYVNLEDHKLTKVDLGTMNGFEIERPVFNSNGDKLVFSAKSSKGKWKIYTFNFETGLITKLFDVDENARFPYYSPDDNYIVFTSDFGGDEEIEIIKVDNPSVRISVTKNNCRDSYPVWSTVFPGEITNQDLQKLIKSKIAFVSERNSHKGVYCVYLNQENANSISIYDLQNNQVVGDKPDTGAMEVTAIGLEGDYPCFTGDGRSLLFEYFDGRIDQLKKLDFETNLEALIQKQSKTYQDLELVQGATRPSGMKNMITNFKAETCNGNEIKLSWNRYTDNDIFYIVQYKVANSEDLYENHVLRQDGALLTGLKMGMDYLVRVFIVENDIEVATSYWVKVKMPEVVARPSFTIDSNNPYLVRLHAWKPEPEENYKWRFSWIVENTEIQVQNSRDYMYEFGTSGTKTIFLKAYTEGQTATHVSDPLEVNVVSDMKPVIEHTLAEDAGYIELSAEKSLGKKLNLASAQWIISGPGREPLTATGSKVIVQLDGFQHKINVSLTLQRIAVNNQSDVAQVNKTIDLDIKEVKPVITYEIAEQNQRLVRFSGEYSQGNVNWNGAKWNLFANGGLLYSVDGATTFDYLFPETNQETVYTVSLTIPRRNDGKTVTVSQVITVEATPIEPKINYQVLELKQGNDVVGAKLLLDCTESKGNGIDYALARWSVAAASNYGEQAVQVGPTAIYNLAGFNQEQVFEVALTLSRKNGSDPVTVTQLINISKNELPQGKLVVNKTVEDATNGKVLTLDVFKSTGPNIDWERTEWVIDGQYSQRGPVVHKELPAASNDTIVSFTCNLYRFGAAKPETISDKVKIGKSHISPVISATRLSGTQNRMYKLSVLDTPGVNIDWERTDWYIYDGGERAVQLKGSVIGYEFPFNSEQLGYPVMVEMYLKGSSKPFVGYTSVDVEGDALTPIITTEVDPENPNLITFKAIDSKGSNINWAQTKWSFGDSKEAQYGPIVTYQYPVQQKSTTYKVTMTLTRNNANGTQEIKTATKDVRMGPDRIKPVIKVTKNGDYLILSAEESLGKGLLLDRCVWLFDGKGDQESSSLNTQSGVLKSSSYNNSATASITKSFGSTYYVTYSAQGSDTTSIGWNMTDYNNLKSQTSNFTSNNSHVGAVCRRYVGGKQNVIVTLFVYRMTPEGGVEGESITVNVDVYNASGVYGR